MSNVTDLKKQCLKEPEFKAAYESMADEFALASAVVEARDQNTTVKTLLRVAEATGTHLKITFEY